MPALSPTMTHGRLSRWLKGAGDRVRSGDLLAEIETDKATMELEALEDGILGALFVKEGEGNIPVNAPIAVLVEEGEEIPAASTHQERASGQVSQQSAETPAPRKHHPQEENTPPMQLPKKKRIPSSPLARRMARESGLQIESLTGTGPNGRIVGRDVEKALASPDRDRMLALSASGSGEEAQEEWREPHTPMRRAIARRLVESKSQAPHFYVSVDVELDALLTLRKELNKALEDEGGRISVNDMMIKAAALALVKKPGLNVRFEEEALVHLPDIDISMAVSVPNGLITPIIFNADRKSLREIHFEARDLAQRAREGKLRLEEFQGGSFSVSNMGMFGVKQFAAIINPPQAAILAIAAGEKRAVVKNGALEIGTVITATLSVDHRAVDGALAAQWLQTFRQIVEAPYALVV